MMIGECPGPDGVALFVDAALAVTAPAREPAIIPAVATPKMNFRMKSLPIRVAIELDRLTVREQLRQSRQFRRVRQ
ncbi:hypothetical protein ACRDU6_17610 [Mycolicibacterium sp. ELW1]|uniref:hypothetical protein n=1 Tax=Mycobacteriaceae TaxID=1762 RepID=UPI00143D2BBC|nr:hypothetical protein [Mycobacterium sp. ELW1]